MAVVAMINARQDVSCVQRVILLPGMATWNPGPGCENTESYPLDCQGIPELVHILEGWLHKDFVENCFSIRYYLPLSSENFIHWQIHALFNLINEFVGTKLERSLKRIRENKNKNI